MKTRYRLKSRWFRKPLIVLQIQITEQRSGTNGYDIEFWDAKFWRDATPEDLINGEIQND